MTADNETTSGPDLAAPSVEFGLDRGFPLDRASR